MQAIHIKLDHQDEEDEDQWSIEIDGRLHEHVSTTAVCEWVEYTLVAAQQSSIQGRNPN